MIRVTAIVLLAALVLSGCAASRINELENQAADLESELSSAQSRISDLESQLEEAQSAMAEIASTSSRMQSAVADLALVNSQFDAKDWQDVMPRLHTSIVDIDSAAEELDSSVQQGVTAVE